MKKKNLRNLVRFLRVVEASALPVPRELEQHWEGLQGPIV